MAFRSRKDGSHYPITPKSTFTSTRPSFSPTQLWQKYNEAQTPEDKLRFKRAAISVANRAKSQGNTDIEQEYRKIIDKMSFGQEKDKEQNRLKVNRYSQDFLVKEGKIGNTQVWVNGAVTPKEKAYAVGAFRRLPPSVQSEVKSIEIISNEGEAHKVGDYQFNAGAHWNRTDGAIRIFTKNNADVQDVKKQDGLIAHEGGHALFDKIWNKANAEKPVQIPDADKIANRVRAARMKHQDEINAKYEPENKTLWEEYDKLGAEAWKLTHDTSTTTEQYEAHNKKRAEIDRKMRTHSRKQSAELAQMNKMYDSNKVLDDLVHHKRPTATMMLDFQDATRKEGGLTNYSNAYVKAHENSQFTENFAEAMRIWYSSDYDTHEAETKANDFPKTYVAFQKMIAADTTGHAVSITDKPLEISA